jgi:hypothetical protein
MPCFLYISVFHREIMKYALSIKKPLNDQNTQPNYISVKIKNIIKILYKCIDKLFD